MRIGDILQRVQSLYNKGIKSDDSRLSDRLIWNKLVSVRAKIIVEDSRKGRSINDHIEQDLYVSMTYTDNLPCGGISTCRSMVSKEFIPLFLDTGKKELVKVLSHDGLINYNRTKFEDVKHISGNKYTSSMQHYFFKSEKLRIVNSKAKKMLIKGVWEDPIKVHRLSETCLGLRHTDLRDIDFYTPSNLIEPIIELTAEELVEDFKKIEHDDANNSNED